MSNNLKRKAQRQSNRESLQCIVGLSKALGCESLQELQLDLLLMGYEVNQKYFSKLPPLSELKKRMQRKATA